MKASGQLAIQLRSLAHARSEKAEQRRRAQLLEDAQALRRYGVPMAFAFAILERVYQRAEVRGYNRAYWKHARPERHTA